MSKQTTPKDGLAKLREPFPAHHISKLPKPTKAQTDEVRQDYKKGIRCQICGQWHHPNVVHLDYVGHAALTDRLLDCDPLWNWEPVASDPTGAPALDVNGGMWIKLTVCGVTRLGYGHPDGKKGGDAIKEVIGDALRNAAMRFGAALDLWHKGDLHLDEGDDAGESENAPPGPTVLSKEAVDIAVSSLSNASSVDQLRAIWMDLPRIVKDSKKVREAGAARKSQLENVPADDLNGDEIPY